MFTHLKHGLLVLAGVYILAACSSSPSPWSEPSSPWGDKSGQSEAVAEESAEPAEQYAFVEPVPEPEEIATPTESAEPEPVVQDRVSPEVERSPVTRNQAEAGNLRGQPAEYFAVQVCASRSMKQLNGFAKRHNVSTEWTAQTSVNGETWYVLLEGIYATRGEAAQALSLIKSEVDTRPWIRTVGSLQAVMQ